MRKQVILALLLFAALIVFPGCSSIDNESDETESVAELSPYETDEEDIEKIDSQSVDELNPYVIDEEGFEKIDLQVVAKITQKQMDDMYGHMSDTITFSVSARGETLVYAGHYCIELEDENMEALRAELEKGTQRMHGYYRDLSEYLYSAGCIENSIVVEYYKKDGQLIYSNEIEYRPINW